MEAGLPSTHPVTKRTEEELDQIASIGQRQLMDGVEDGKVATLSVQAQARKVRTTYWHPKYEDGRGLPQPLLPTMCNHHFPKFLGLIALSGTKCQYCGQTEKEIEERHADL